MAPCIMAQSADFEPPTPYFLNIAGGHPQTRSQDLASILKDVVIDQNGNDNPSHHTVLLLMELRANIENRHDFPNACQEPEPDSVIWAIDEAMHLSLQFLQRMTDLNGNFEPLVTSSLHLAKLILHTVDTSELGDPDAVTIIKQLRKKQTTDMYRLRERWEDLLQTADDHDESATFKRLSNIMDYTEDFVNDAWFDAKSFTASCEELIRYRLDDTFLPDTYASVHATPPPANNRAQITPRENPEPTKPQKPTANSDVEAIAANATITGQCTPQYQTPMLKTALDHQNPTPNGEATTNATITGQCTPQYQTPMLKTALDYQNPTPNGKATTTEPIPTHQETTPTHDLNNAHQAAAGRHLSDFSTTLTTQRRRVDNVMTEIVQRVENETLLAEVQSLATITDESAREATHLAERPTLPTENEQGKTPSPREKRQNYGHTITDNQGSTDTEKDTEQYRETTPIYSTNKQNRPIFFPIDRNWYYLGARNAPTVRQVEIVQRPPGIYIGPFTGPPPAENTANQNEDHNWRRKWEKRCQEEMAIPERNWPESRAESKHDGYINKQHRYNRPVADGDPRETVDRKSNVMDNNTRRRFEALHIPEWIEIRNIPDEEPPTPYQGPGPFEAPWRPRLNQTTPSTPTSNEIRRVTTEQGPPSRVRGMRLPRPGDMIDTPDDGNTAQYPPPIRGETREEMWKTPYPTASRTNHEGSSPPKAEAQPGLRHLRDITNAGGHGARHPPTTVRASPRQSSSSSPETPRTPRDSGLEDVLVNTPVLSRSNPRTRNDSSENSQDDAAAVAALLEYGRSIREENARDRSTDSSESSAGDATRPGRPRIRGLARPRSYILRDEIYVEPTDIRNMRQNDTDHACQNCKDGSRCWCPIREDLLPDNNGRTPRSRQLRRCKSCQKTFIIIGNSRQKCCGSWISGTPQTSPER